MGKSQSARLERKSAQFRKELYARGIRVMTVLEKQQESNRQANERRKAELKKLTELINGYEYENKSQPKSARIAKRIRSKQMA